MVTQIRFSTSDYGTCSSGDSVWWCSLARGFSKAKRLQTFRIMLTLFIWLCGRLAKLPSEDEESEPLSSVEILDRSTLLHLSVNLNKNSKNHIWSKEEICFFRRTLRSFVIPRFCLCENIDVMAFDSESAPLDGIIESMTRERAWSCSTVCDAKWGYWVVERSGAFCEIQQNASRSLRRSYLLNSSFSLWEH